MNLKKIFFLILLIISTLTLSGCQGGNSDSQVDPSGGSVPTVPVVIPDTNTSSAIVNVNVILPVSLAILTTNNQVVNISVRVFDSANNPYSIGTITKVNPNDVLTGRDIGSFDKDTSPLVNGIASFTYNAPDSLDVNTSNISFGFYHDSNSSSVQVFTMSIVPDVNQTVLTNYTLKSSNESDVNMNLESRKTFSFGIYDAGDNPLPDANITKIIVTSLNPSLVLVKDNTLRAPGSTLSINNQNNFTINLISNIKSGLAPIKVDATFSDANGGEQNLTKIFNLVVFSGPPTAASLGYISSSFNETTGLYTEAWRLMVTDKHSNLVNTNPAVYSSMIVGYATSSATTENSASYLYYTTEGTMATSGGKAQLTSSAAAFSNVDLVNDDLVVFGTGYKFNTFGKWDINTNTSSTVLDLNDDFNSSSTSGLGFAVGHNLRNETCNGDATVASVKAKDDNTTLSDDGLLTLEATFNDYMVGKSVVLSTNFVGGHNNINGQLGYAKKITFVGTGLTSSTYIVKRGSSIGVKRLRVYVQDSPYGITYKNSNFSYDVQNTADLTPISVSGNSNNNITSCVNGGYDYVDVNITALAGGNGELTLINLRVGAEF